jgi:hypothetical protein
MPIAGAGLLLWVAYKGAIGLSGGEKEVLGAVAVLAIIMTVVAVKVYKSPIFQIKAEAATTTEPTVNIGSG